MFSCPNCSADRSRVLPVDPCPACGEMLEAPEAKAAPAKKRFPTVDTSMDTGIASKEEAADAVAAASGARADTLAEEDEHLLPTVAEESGPSAELLKAASQNTPPPDTEEVSAVEVTATETSERPSGMPPSNDVGDSTDPSIDLEVEVDDDSIDSSAPPAKGQNKATPSPAANPPFARAESPDVLTRTIADEQAAVKERPAPTAAGLPPLPSPRTPKPSAPPPIPGRTEKDASRSGVVSSAPVQPKPAPGPASKAPASVASAASRSGVVSSAAPLPGMGASPPRPGTGASPPTPGIGRPSDVLPRPPGPGRPSDILPRPPASAVIRPSPAPSVAATPGPGAVPPAMAGNLGPASMLANQAPPGMVSSQAPHMMQSFPTPSNMARPPAPGMMQSPPPNAVDPSMAAMPSAYALPGSGYQGVARAPTPAPLVHTPIPPGLIGPPPDLNESGGLGAALDSLDYENRAPREDTPSANAVWRNAHPSAQKWAAKRHGGSVRTPKPGIIALGLLLAGFGAYLLAIFLPSKGPLTAAMKQQLESQAGVDEHAWHFSDTLIDAANINAALFVLLGVVIVLRGALYQQQPAGHARKGLSKPAILLIFCFVLLAVSFGALVMSAST